MVRAVLPTPPSPSTTSLYSVILPAMLPTEWQCQGASTVEAMAVGESRGGVAEADRVAQVRGRGRSSRRGSWQASSQAVRQSGRRRGEARRAAQRSAAERRESEDAREPGRRQLAGTWCGDAAMRRCSDAAVQWCCRGWAEREVDGGGGVPTCKRLSRLRAATALSPINNGYQGSVAWTRATWDGGGRTIAAAMAEESGVESGASEPRECLGSDGARALGHGRWCWTRPRRRPPTPARTRLRLRLSIRPARPRCQQPTRARGCFAVSPLRGPSLLSRRRTRQPRRKCQALPAGRRLSPPPA